MITDKGLEGFFSIFALDTGSRVTRFGIYLPIPNKAAEEAISILKKSTGGFSLQLDPIPGDYIIDTSAVVNLRERLSKI